MLLSKLKAILRHNRFRLFTRPYELNIIGLRSDSTIPNRFDDEIHVFYKATAGKWKYHVFKATTDPGTFWLRNPMQEQGTAILSQGQYVDAYQVGMHQGQYKALIQCKAVTILRDYNRNAKLDFLNGKKSKGIYGINIHKANAQGTTKYVDSYSAGCQVFENAEGFVKFLLLCEYHRKLYGNRFTYTLIDFRAVKRETYRRISLSAGLVGLIALGFLGFTYSEKFQTIAQQIENTFHQVFKRKATTKTTANEI